MHECPACRATVEESTDRCPACGAALPPTEAYARTRVAGPQELAQRHPRQIGDIAILREVGRGGMGIVYEGLQADHRVAVKILAADAADPESIFRFQREASAAAMLRHENIVPVTQFGQVEGIYYYVMPFVEGESLAARLRRAGPLDAMTAARLALQAARALEYAHRSGIVHRDVKPHNLMLSDRLQVTDFGLARTVTAPTLTATGVTMGTPAYMSPEQAAGDRRALDHRTDIYSLGATLYEMVTGRPPFVGEEMVAILRQIEETDPAPPSSIRMVPRDLETIILCAMEKRPGHRYATAAAMSEDIERFIAGRPIAARRSGAISKAFRAMARRKAATAAVALLLALVVAGIVALRKSREAKKTEQQVREALGETKEAHLKEAEKTFRAAEILFGQKKWDEAAKLYQEVIGSESPLAPEARRALAELCLEAGRLDEARKWIQALGSPAVLAAKLALREGDPKKAIELAKPLVDDPDAWDVLARAYAALKDFDAERTAIKERTARQRARAEKTLAEAAAEKDPGRAEALYRRALAITDALGLAEPEAAAKYGELLLRRGLAREALPYVDRSPDAVDLRVRARVALGLWHEAHALFRAKDLTPEKAELGVRIGLAMIDPDLLRTCARLVKDPRLSALATGESADPVLRALMGNGAADLERALPTAKDPAVRGTILFRLERFIEASHEFDRAGDPVGRIGCAYALRGERAALDLAEAAPPTDAILVARIALLYLNGKPEESAAAASAYFEGQPPMPAVLALLSHLSRNIMAFMPKGRIDRLMTRFRNSFLQRMQTGEREAYVRLFNRELNLDYRPLLPILTDALRLNVSRSGLIFEAEETVVPMTSDAELVALLEDADSEAAPVRDAAEQRLRALNPSTASALDRLAARPGYAHAATARRWAAWFAGEARRTERDAFVAWLRTASFRHVVRELKAGATPLKTWVLGADSYRGMAGSLPDNDVIGALEECSASPDGSVAMVAMQGLFHFDRAAFGRRLATRAGLLTVPLVGSAEFVESLRTLAETGAAELRPLAFLVLASAGIEPPVRRDFPAMWARVLAEALLDRTPDFARAHAADPDPDTRVAASLVLGYFGDPEPLLKLAEDAEVRVALAALHALGRFDRQDALETSPFPETWAFLLLGLRLAKAPIALDGVTPADFPRLEKVLRRLVERSSEVERICLGVLVARYMTRVPLPVDLMRTCFTQVLFWDDVLNEIVDAQLKLRPGAADEIRDLVRDLVVAGPGDFRATFFSLAQTKAWLGRADYLRLLESDHPEVRFRAVAALSSAPEEAVPRLLDHEDMHVRRGAACLMVRWRRAGLPGYDDLSPWATTPRRREALAWALWRRACPQASQRGLPEGLCGGDFDGGVVVIFTDERAQKDYAPAFLREAFGLDPSRPRYARDAAAALRELDRPKEAIEFLGPIVERLAPEEVQMRAEMYAALGWAHGRLSEGKEAVACYERSVTEIPGRADFLMSLGKALLQIKDNAGALERASAVLALDPRSGAAHLLRGRALKRLGRLEEAAVSFSNAIAFGASPTPEDREGLSFDKALLQSLLDQMQFARSNSERRRLAKLIAPLLDGVPPAVLEWAAANGSSLRAGALVVIGEAPSEKRGEAAWGAIVRLAQDDNPEIRADALNLLRWTATEYGSNKPLSRLTDAQRAQAIAAARAAFRSLNQEVRLAGAGLLVAVPMPELWPELVELLESPDIEGASYRLAGLRNDAMDRLAEEVKDLPEAALKRLREGKAVEPRMVLFAGGERGEEFMTALLADLERLPDPDRRLGELLAVSWDPRFARLILPWLEPKHPYAGLILAGAAPELSSEVLSRLMKITPEENDALRAIFEWRRLAQRRTTYVERRFPDKLPSEIEVFLSQCLHTGVQTSTALEIVDLYDLKSATEELRTLMNDESRPLDDRLEAAKLLLVSGDGGGAPLLVTSLEKRLENPRSFATPSLWRWGTYLEAAGRSRRREFAPVLRAYAERAEDDDLKKAGLLGLACADAAAAAEVLKAREKDPAAVLDDLALRAHDQEIGLSIVEQAVAIAPTAARQRRLADLLNATEKYERALESARTALHLEDSADAHNLAGVALDGLKRFSDAIPEYERAIALDGDKPLYRANLAWSLGQSGQAARAEEVLREAARLFPKDDGVLYRMGLLFFKQERYDDAIEWFDRRIATGEEAGWARIYRAGSLRELWRLDEAETEVEAVLKYMPRWAPALAARAGLRLDRGESKAALADAAEAVRLDPKFAEGWRQRGRAKATFGDSPEADLAKAIELDPNNGKALLDLVLWRISQAKWEEAEKLIGQTEGRGTLEARARLAVARGLFDDAMKLLAQATPKQSAAYRKHFLSLEVWKPLADRDDFRRLSQ